MEMCSNQVVTLVGFQIVDFTKRETGERVQGTKIWWTCPSENQYVNGVVTGDAFINSFCSHLSLNEQYRLIYTSRVWQGKQILKVTGLELVG